MRINDIMNIYLICMFVYPFQCSLSPVLVQIMYGVVLWLLLLLFFIEHTMDIHFLNYLCEFDTFRDFALVKHMYASRSHCVLAGARHTNLPHAGKLNTIKLAWILNLCMDLVLHSTALRNTSCREIVPLAYYNIRNVGLSVCNVQSTYSICFYRGYYPWFLPTTQTFF